MAENTHINPSSTEEDYTEDQINSFCYIGDHYLPDESKVEIINLIKHTIRLNITKDENDICEAINQQLNINHDADWTVTPIYYLVDDLIEECYFVNFYINETYGAIAWKLVSPSDEDEDDDEDEMQLCIPPAA